VKKSKKKKKKTTPKKKGDGMFYSEQHDELSPMGCPICFETNAGNS